MKRIKKAGTIVLGLVAMLTGAGAKSNVGTLANPAIQRIARSQVSFPDRTDDSEVKTGTRVSGIYTIDMSGGASNVNFYFNQDRITSAFNSGYDASYDYMEAVFEGNGLDTLWDTFASVFLQGKLASIPYDIVKSTGKVTLTFQIGSFPTAQTLVDLFVKNLPMSSAPTLSGLASSDGTGGLFLTINSYKLPKLVQDGETAEVYINVDDPLSIEQILANVTAQDLLGENVTVNCTVEEKAKYNSSNIGIYKITVTATDKYGQTATCYLNIHVVDTVDPTISLVKAFDFTVGSTLQFSKISEYISITDNGTSHGGTIGNATYTIDGQAFNSDRTWGADDVGNHTIKVTVADSSGNSATKEFSITVR